jgi:hypothetical protein
MMSVVEKGVSAGLAHAMFCRRRQWEKMEPEEAQSSLKGQRDEKITIVYSGDTNPYRL